MLKVIRHIEESIRHRDYLPARTRRLTVSAVPNDPSETIALARDRRVRQTFKVEAYASLVTTDDGPALVEAKRKAGQLIAHQLFGELREELLELLHWSMEEGIGRDLEERIGRLIELTEGKDPHPTP